MYLYVHSISPSKCISKLAQLRPPRASQSSHDFGLWVNLWVQSTSASKCISKLAWSWPPSASPSLFNHSLQFHLKVHSNSASDKISKLPPSWAPIASLSSLYLGPQVHLHTHSTVASKHRSKFTQSGYDAARLVSEGNLWESVVLARWALRRSTRGYHGVPGRAKPLKLCGSVKSRQVCRGRPTGKDWLCVIRKIKYHLNTPLYPFLPSPGCPLPNWMAVAVWNRFSHPDGLQAPHYILSISGSRCSSKFPWEPSAARLTLCICFKRVMFLGHTILPCPEVCDLIKVGFDGRNALWLMNPKNDCCENSPTSLLQTCTAVSAAPKFSYSISQISEHLRMPLQILRTLCLAPGGPGSIWKYLEVLVRATGVLGRFVFGFRTDLHFADIILSCLLVFRCLRSLVLRMNIHSLVPPFKQSQLVERIKHMCCNEMHTHPSSHYSEVFVKYLACKLHGKEYVLLRLRLLVSWSSHNTINLIVHVIVDTSAKHHSVWKPCINLPGTLVALASASMFFQMLPAPPWTMQSAFRFFQSILTCSWLHLQWWKCFQDATRFDN